MLHPHLAALFWAMPVPVIGHDKGSFLQPTWNLDRWPQVVESSLGEQLFSSRNSRRPAATLAHQRDATWRHNHCHVTPRDTFQVKTWGWLFAIYDPSMQINETCGNCFIMFNLDNLDQPWQRQWPLLLWTFCLLSTFESIKAWPWINQAMSTLD